MLGGQSSRYGSPKMFAEINGIPFYEAAYQALINVCNDVVIVTRREFVKQFPEHYNVITDIEPFIGDGPLAGIYSAMISYEAEQYIVLPCDMPLYR